MKEIPEYQERHNKALIAAYGQTATTWGVYNRTYFIDPSGILYKPEDYGVFSPCDRQDITIERTSMPLEEGHRIDEHACYVCKCGANQFLCHSNKDGCDELQCVACGNAWLPYYGCEGED